MQTTPPILIIATGNESRGDDAIAPLLLRRLATQGLPDSIELLEEFQLQVEHALDIGGRELILFMDAGMDTPAPYTFYRAQLGNSRPLFSHALAPEAVLATYARLYQQCPPPAFVLCIRGQRFELGASLSIEAGEYLELAARFVQELLRETEAATWESRCTPATK